MPPFLCAGPRKEYFRQAGRGCATYNCEAIIRLRGE